MDMRRDLGGVYRVKAARQKPGDEPGQHIARPGGRKFRGGARIGRRVDAARAGRVGDHRIRPLQQHDAAGAVCGLARRIQPRIGRAAGGGLAQPRGDIGEKPRKLAHMRGQHASRVKLRRKARRDPPRTRSAHRHPARHPAHGLRAARPVQAPAPGPFAAQHQRGDLAGHLLLRGSRARPASPAPRRSATLPAPRAGRPRCAPPRRSGPARDRGRICAHPRAWRGSPARARGRASRPRPPGPAQADIDHRERPHCARVRRRGSAPAWRRETSP